MPVFPICKDKLWGQGEGWCDEKEGPGGAIGPSLRLGCRRGKERGGSKRVSCPAWQLHQSYGLSASCPHLPSSLVVWTLRL